MEERYVNVNRRQSGTHSSPPRRRLDDWEEPPVRKSSRKPKKNRSAAKALLMAAYKFLVVVSVLIVAAYAGFHLMVKAPEQSGGVTPPAQGGNTTGASLPSTLTPGSSSDPSARQLRPGVYNILLAATDKGGSLTDIMMVMQYDTAQQTVGVVSVPRDTIVPREKGSNPHLAYGKGGVEQRMVDISQMLGIPIDYYIKVNINGFISLVDYLDGIDFYVPCDMNYDDPFQDLHIHYKQGQQHLSGQQAMEVARFRKNNADKNGNSTGYSDTGRTETQQQLLVALAKKVLAWGNLTKINGFVKIFNETVDTDLSLNDMLYFASQALNLDPSSAVETATLPGRGDAVYNGSTWCYELELDGTLEIVNRLINPYNQDLTLDDMNLPRAQSYYP